MARRGEEVLASLALAAMVILPLIEMASRRFGFSLPGAMPIAQHLTLWVAMLGAALAAREDKLLALAAATYFPERIRRGAKMLSFAVAAAVATLLARAAVDLIVIEQDAGTRVTAWLPAWVAQLALPIGFGLIALRLAWFADRRWPGRLVALVACGGALVVGARPEIAEGISATAPILVLVLATVLGAPLFAVLGGAALVLFLRDGVPAAAVSAETYRLVVSPTLPAIPLFTLAGFLLSEGGAPQRLLRLMRAFVGWCPGGTAVVATLLCAVFTLFTGGSGVTILALGALLLQAMNSDGYRERFSIGLITASGSLGLLLPPALPLILYGIVAGVPIEDLFRGGLVPGLLLITIVAAWAMREGVRAKLPRQRFEIGEVGRAVWAAKWEVGLPVVVLIALLTGITTVVESAAVAAAGAAFTQLVVHRELSPSRTLDVLRECLVLVGGVLLILGVALGFTSWLVDAQIPAALVDAAREHIGSRFMFLLLLTVFLLIVGCLMDIFSAIVVVAPLLVPLGEAFGVHPVQLGIIFIANLELGYLTPPVGLNLFLASYRFDRPVLEIARATAPFLAIRAVGVLLVTFVPALTLMFLSTP